MARKHFETRAELERQMEAARQLRAETLACAGWLFSAFAGAVAVVRRMLLRLAAHAPHQA